MNYSENPYASPMGPFAAMAEADVRANFITKTYLHLTGTIALFVALEAILLSTPFTANLVGMMIGGRYSWLIVLGLFMLVSYVAQSWAQSATSIGMQYLGIGTICGGRSDHLHAAVVHCEQSIRDSRA